MPVRDLGVWEHGLAQYVKTRWTLVGQTSPAKLSVEVPSKVKSGNPTPAPLAGLFVSCVATHSPPSSSNSRPSVMAAAKLYVVEHLDPELGPWSKLEYLSIAEESNAAGSGFCLSSVSPSLKLPPELHGVPGLRMETEGVETFLADEKGRVCLLDPSAGKDLSPEDGDLFDVFLFGGILGMLSKFLPLCLTHANPLPSRLGDDPPRDRTSELRKKGYEGRRLGSKQMTTDTAVRVTRKVIQDKVPLSQIAYIDFPELRINKHESIEMPFRYVKGEDGQPVMPQGMLELIKNDSEKGFGDLF